jgi:hypothetical protein
MGMVRREAAEAARLPREARKLLDEIADMLVRRAAGPAGR